MAQHFTSEVYFRTVASYLPDLFEDDILRDFNQFLTTEVGRDVFDEVHNAVIRKVRRRIARKDQQIEGHEDETLIGVEATLEWAWQQGVGVRLVDEAIKDAITKPFLHDKFKRVANHFSRYGNLAFWAARREMSTWIRHQRAHGFVDQVLTDTSDWPEYTDVTRAPMTSEETNTRRQARYDAFVGHVNHNQHVIDV